MRKEFILFLFLIGFILGFITISFGGDKAGFKVYSGTGSHNTGIFVPATEGEVTIISQPEVQEKVPAKQDSEETHQKKVTEIKNTIIFNDNKEYNQNYYLPYRRYKRSFDRPKVEHYSKIRTLF